MPYIRFKKTPDSVLNKCKDMVALGTAGDREDAWSAISDFLSSKKRGWRPAHHELMLLFVELSITLLKNPKDGFIQYRMICSTNQLDSLKTCLQNLMEKASEKGDEEYTELMEQFKDRDLDDSEVKSEFNKLQFAKPYLKYQWSVYKAVLDVLRNNQKLDPVYQSTVHRAIEYCVRLGRTNEFRKLCDVARKHLTAIFGHQNQTNKVEIHTPQMLGIYLNTRFDLLENATALQMWQEAFRLITDIHQLKDKSKTALDPALETNYYKKLSLIFLESKNMLLHAYSILRYYSLSRDAFDLQQSEGELDFKKRKIEGVFYERLKEEEIVQLGKKCLLATLAAPIPRSRSQVLGPPMTTEDKKNKTMAGKLNFYARPNRNNLLEQCHYEDLLDPNEDFKMLKKLIVEETSPLTLCEQVSNILKRIVDQNPDLTVYAEHVQNAVVRKLLLSVSKMYSSINIDRLQLMFFEGWSQRQIENLILQMVEKGYIWCRMSHREGMCHFRAPDRLERNSFMQSYLSNLAHSLNTLYDKELARDHAVRSEFFDKVREGVKNDNKHIISRQSNIVKTIGVAEKKQCVISYIEKQKKLHNKWSAEEALRKETERIALLKINEKRRRAQEAIKEKRAKEASQIAKNQLKKVRDAVSSDILKTNSKKLDSILKSNEATSKEAIEAVTVNYLQSIKEAQEDKKAGELKFQDYFVRACRKEEIPLLHKQYRVSAESKHEEILPKYKIEVQKQRKNHAALLVVKKMNHVASDHTNWFRQRLESRREKQFQTAKAIQDEQKQRFDEKREQQRLRQQNKREQQQNEVRRRQQDERKQREEAMQRQKEENERRQAAMSARATEPPPVRQQPPRQQAPPVRREDPPPRRSMRDDPPLRREDPPPRRSMRDDPPLRKQPDSPGGGWTTMGSRRGRSKFTNSKKAEQEQQQREQQQTDPKSLAQGGEPPARTSLRGPPPANPTRSIRGDAPMNWRNRNNVQEAGAPARQSNKPLRPPAPTQSNSIRRAAPLRSGNNAGRTGRGNFAPLEPTPVRPLRRAAPPQQAGEPRGAGKNERRMGEGLRSPAPTRNTIRGDPAQGGRLRSAPPQGGGWRSRQRQQEHGVSDPSAFRRNNSNRDNQDRFGSGNSGGEPPRRTRFFDSRKAKS